MHKALLVFHSPTDDLVGIDNASHIFTTAKHPKSFVSLAGADHLLSRASDAVYVAHVVAAWAERYLDMGAAASTEAEIADGAVVVRETRNGLFQQEVTVGQHRFLADEPVQAGGTDTGPGPYDLLLAALGACTSMTVRLYADRKQICSNAHTSICGMERSMPPTARTARPRKARSIASTGRSALKAISTTRRGCGFWKLPTSVPCTGR